MALNATYASTPCFVHELLNEIYAPSCHPPIEAARAVAKAHVSQRSRPARDARRQQRRILRRMDRAMMAARASSANTPGGSDVR